MWFDNFLPSASHSDQHFYAGSSLTKKALDAPEDVKNTSVINQLKDGKERLKTETLWNSNDSLQTWPKNWVTFYSLMSNWRVIITVQKFQWSDWSNGVQLNC